MAFVAPAGTAITARDLVAWIAGCLQTESATTVLTQSVQSTFGVPWAGTISSGRAGLTLILRGLYDLDPAKRNEVILPSYTCYSVPASAVRAGLRVRVCDIDPSTLSYDLEYLRAQDFTNVLAIVSASLYGIPNDLPAIESIARDRGVYMVDDAAQAMGALAGGRLAGTFGDAGLYSLDKGKNITSIQGGILIAKQRRIADCLHEMLASLPRQPSSTVLSYSIQLLAYAFLLHPALYWIPERLLDLGRTIYTTEWPTTQYSPALAAMAVRLFRRLDSINRLRREHAHRLAGFVAAHPLLHTPAPENVRAVYARFPIIMPSQEVRDRCLSRMRSCGIGASISYPQSIADVPELDKVINHPASSAERGRIVAQRIMTLPTHGHVRPRHLRLIEQNLAQCL